MNNYPKAIVNALLKIYKHRRALWIAGRKLGVSTARLIKHDNSKFHPIEFMQYVKRFELGIDEPDKWAKAWEHHWRNNDHHIEYWIDKDLTFDWSGYGKQKRYSPDPEIIGLRTKDEWPEIWMPDDAIREMIADWMAASYAYAGEWPKAPDWKWGNDNLQRKLMLLEHTAQPETSTRGFAVLLLQKQGMITNEMATRVCTL